jgi:DDE superfamily endonuclease
VENFEDLYTDYLLCSFGQTTATGLSDLLDGAISHDKITRCLSQSEYDSKYLWKRVKPYVEELTQSGERIVLNFDDSIEEKLYSDESELICWHYDHVFSRNIKGVNFLTALVEVGGMRLPCAVEFIKKDTWEMDQKTGKKKRKCSKTKNEYFREMITRCYHNFRFDYVACDSWYSSIENMILVKKVLKVNFVMALKSNRKVALSLEDKNAKKYVSIESLQPGQQTVEIWLEDLDFPLLLVKQVFKNEDDTVGELYLACSDLNLSYGQVTTIYKKRWGVEEYHKSIKSNAGFAKSPTHTVRTQCNHFMLSVLAYVKLEWMNQRNKKNHFAMKAKIYRAAVKAAYMELKKLYTPAYSNAA